jgi:hypothetical protein
MAAFRASVVPRRRTERHATGPGLDARGSRPYSVAMRRVPLSTPLVTIFVLAALLVGVGVWLDSARPRLSSQEVRSALFSTIERESPAAFLVTGRLEMTVTTRMSDSRVLLPGLLGIDLGTSRATVRVPGGVSYGFEADSLKPEMVRLLEDGVVEVEIPPLAVYSVEPDLGQLEVETERGWARVGTTEDELERQALMVVEGAMRRQALSHLRSSYQPRINTARALERILAPALEGLGMEAPRFRFRLGEDLVVEPTG